MGYGLVIAATLLLSVLGGVLVVRNTRQRFVREKHDWRTFALGFPVVLFVGFALAWLMGARDPLYLASMALFAAIICFGSFVWPPMPRDYAGAKRAGQASFRPEACLGAERNRRSVPQS
jgi:hypothetical protein